jgi:hypothetical protein
MRQSGTESSFMCVFSAPQRGKHAHNQKEKFLAAAGENP